MIQLSAVRLIAAGVGLLLAVAILFGAGWTIRGWKDEAEIAGLKTEQANTAAEQANAALSDLASATATINKAARRYGEQQSELATQIADLKKDLKNEIPLPADCVPSAGRVRKLQTGIDTVNKAIAGQRPSSAVPRN
ncbi:MAG: hypothetical protein ABFE02_08940 [Sulfuricella sp.]